MKKSGLIFLLLFLSSAFFAQVDSIRFKFPQYEKNLLIPAYEELVINVLINRVDAMVLNKDWAKVSPATWRENFRRGFGTDGDIFSTNFIGHPFHGSFYFNAARQHGVSFWGAIPYTFAGSFIWEFFGETQVPSEIDWNTTTLGGIYLGEVTYRLAHYLLRSHKQRVLPFVRDLSVMVINPIFQINGLFDSDKMNEARRLRPQLFPIRSQFNFGYSRIFRLNKDVENISYFNLSYSLIYGDFFKDEHYKPFDFFVLRAWVDINSLTLFGDNYFSILSHAPIWKLKKLRNGSLSVSNHYNFIHNQIFKTGSISLTLDYNWGIKKNKTEILASFKAGPILFGSSQSEVIDELNLENEDGSPFLRDYVYGRGFLFEFESLIIYKPLGRLIVNFNNWTLYAVSDANGTERNSIFKIEYYYPIYRNFSIGIEFFRYHRAANYKDLPQFQNIRKSYSEIKILGSLDF